jgi:molecular chaperone DnaJ
MSKDYYADLGVDKNASEADIKKAYRKAAMNHHPDRGGDEKEFKKVNEAYETLSNKQKRAQYDQFGSDGPAAGGFGGGGFGGFDQGGFGNVDLGDIFESFFTGGGRQSQQGGRTETPRGYDLEMSFTLDFEESIFGAKKDITLQHDVSCNSCTGTGAKGGNQTSCGHCHGTGQTVKKQQTPFGVVQMAGVCGHCKGEGSVAKDICHDCHGKGIQSKKETITVQIPAGTEDRSTIRLRGYGSAVKKGESGDLYLRISVKKHSQFVRQGQDLIKHIEIHVLQAILGGEVEVITLREKKKIKIPSGISENALLKISGEGVQTATPGDLLLHVHIYIPQKLNKKDKEMYTELAKNAGLLTSSDKKKKSFWSF